MHVPHKFLSFLSVCFNLSDAKLAASLFLSCGLETYHERLSVKVLMTSSMQQLWMYIIYIYIYIYSPDFKNG